MAQGEILEEEEEEREAWKNLGRGQAWAGLGIPIAYREGLLTFLSQTQS